MGLDPPGPLAGMVLQAAPGGIEGVAQGDVDVLVGVALTGIAVDHHLLARDAHLDVDVEKVALHVLAADGFDHHAAGRDPAIDLLQLCHLFPHPRLYGRSEEHTSELQSLMRIAYAVLRLKKKKKREKN